MRYVQVFTVKLRCHSDFGTKEERLMREMNESRKKREREKNGGDSGVVASIMASLTSHCEGF